MHIHHGITRIPPRTLGKKKILGAPAKFAGSKETQWVRIKVLIG